MKKFPELFISRSAIDSLIPPTSLVGIYSTVILLFMLLINLSFVLLFVVSSYSVDYFAIYSILNLSAS